MDKTLRTLKLDTDRMTSLRLSAADWRAIDQSAADQGKHWAEWARAVLAAHPHERNRAGLLRRVALRDAIGRELLAERAENYASAGASKHAMLNHRFWALSADDVEAELGHWKKEGKQEIQFDAFELIAGYRQDGRPVVLVRSKLEGDLSVLLLRDELKDD